MDSPAPLVSLIGRSSYKRKALRAECADARAEQK